MYINRPNKLKAVIVDDEKIWREEIEMILREHFSNTINIVSIVSTIPTAIISIKENKPDLVILDLKIGNAWSFDILKEFKEPDFFTIFLTAYPDKYAQCLLEKSQLTFIEKNELSAAALKAFVETAVNINKKNQRDKYLVLMRVMNGEDIISLQSISGDTKILHRDEIFYATIDDKTITYFTLKDQIKVLNSLDNALKQLNSSKNDNDSIRFFKIRRDAIVNLKYISNIKKSTIEVISPNFSPVKLKLSKYRKNELKRLLKILV